ncbi:MAG: hypothetical protein ACI9XC_001614 [Gammaproteobacteria bacterium]|jgi:hypothetical protein
MSKYEEARNLAILSIEKALIAHGNDDVFSIEDDLEEFDLLIPRDEIVANSLLFLTLEFWSGWSDSAIHGWYFYEPLEKDDWPRLAQILLNDLKTNTEVTNQEIVSQFSVFPKTKSDSIFSKISSLIGG